MMQWTTTPSLKSTFRTANCALLQGGWSVSLHEDLLGNYHVQWLRCRGATEHMREPERWPGAWLSVSVDGAAALVAHSLDDEHATGIWTENSHVAWTLYGGLASETALTALTEIAARNPMKKRGTRR